MLCSRALGVSILNTFSLFLAHLCKDKIISDQFSFDPGVSVFESIIKICVNLQKRLANIVLNQQACLSGLQSKNVMVEKSTALKDKPKIEELVFGMYIL